MSRLVIELTDKDALADVKELEKKNKIKIINQINTNSYGLPGEPLSDKEFSEWLAMAEESDEISLDEAKKEWKSQKEEIKKNSVNIFKEGQKTFANELFRGLKD